MIFKTFLFNVKFFIIYIFSFFQKNVTRYLELKHCKIGDYQNYTFNQKWKSLSQKLIVEHQN